MHKLHWETITREPLLVQRVKGKLLRKWCINDTLMKKRRSRWCEYSRPQMCETSATPGMGKCEQLHDVKWPVW